MKNKFIFPLIIVTTILLCVIIYASKDFIKSRFDNFIVDYVISQAYSKDSVDERIKSLEKIAKKYPKSADIFISLGDSYLFDKKDNENAIKAYKTSIELGAQSIVAYGNLGRIYARNNDMKEAVKYFEKGFEIDKSNYLNNSCLLMTYGRLGDMKKLINFGKLAEHSLQYDIQFYNMYIEALMAIWHYKNAEDASKLFIEDAQQICEKDEAYKTDQIRCDIDARKDIALSIIALEREDYKKAFEHLEEAKQASKHPETLYLLEAAIYMGQSNLEKAGECITRAEKYLKESDVYSYRVKIMYEIKKGNYKDAEAYIKKLNLEDLNAIYLSSQLYKRQKHYDKATDGYKQILKIVPFHLAARKNLAECYIELDKKDLAKEQLELILSYEPDEPQKIEIQKMLDSIK